MDAAQADRPSGGWNDLTVPERFHSSIGGGASDQQAASAGRGVLAPLRARLLLTDLVLIAVALVVGLLVSSRQSAWSISPLMAIYGTPAGIAVLWLGCLALRGSYDQRIIGLGTEEIRRIVSATLYTFAVVAGVSYLVRADISRAYAFVSLPLGLGLIIGGRFAWRGWLYRRRRLAQFMTSTVVVGTGPASDELADRLTRNSFAGYMVVSRYPAPLADRAHSAVESESFRDWSTGLVRLIDTEGVAAVALAPSESLSGEAIREIAWLLESRNVDLLIAPAIMEVTGPRLTVRPAAGLPLLHLDQVSLSRPQRFTKRSLDLVGAGLLIMVLSPLLVICACWVKLTSQGPVIFRQTRIGRGGQPFRMLKFRTMVEGADAQREALREEYGKHDPMFKIGTDPRITKAGKVLRRWSLDELPQLFNAFGGSMSLVGPRPHPIDDVNRYEAEAYRRLALKPGMTGLWQVEGRNDLSWSEALELDLYYVETWSLAGDLVLLLRTFRAVLQGRGAV